MGAPKGNKNSVGNKGYSGKYKEEYAEMAYNIALLGATDKQLADIFQVTEATINGWKKTHFEFFDSLKRGKAEADTKVTRSLFERANGYEAPDLYITQYQGQVITKQIIKFYPPDVLACIFWLKNRQPALWRDRVDHDHTTKGESLNQITVTADNNETKNEIEKLIDFAAKNN